MDDFDDASQMYCNNFSLEQVFDDIEESQVFDLTNKLQVMLINIRRMNTNFTNLKIFLERLRYKPDVIVCTETGILPNYNFYSLKEYNCYYNEGDVNIADGVMIYSRKNIDVKRHDIDTIHKCKILSVEFKINKNETFLISGVYRNHDIDKDNFMNNIIGCFLEKNKKTKNHLIAGDFNINIMDTDDKTLDYVNNFLEYKYIPLFNQITRPNLSANRVQDGTCIDNMFLKSSKTNTQSYTIKTLITDHYPLFATLDFNRNIEIEPKRKSYLSYKRVKILAERECWSDVLSLQEPEFAMNLLIKKVQNIVDSSRIIVKNNKRHTNRKPYISAGILKSIHTKEKLYLKWSKDKENQILERKYKNYVKILDRVIRKAKLMYDTKKLQEIQIKGQKNLGICQ